jgi:Universal stress protein UspA and related nucleotide-binding proteins
MYRKILVGFKNTEEGRDALELGQALARASGATMLVASVSSRHDGGKLALEAGEERLVAYLSAHLDDLDIAVEGRCLTASSPAAGLAELARAEDCDPIVLGSTRRGPIGRILSGRTAERLIGGSRCGVAIAPRGLGAKPESDWHPLSEEVDDAGMRVIGVGYDGSRESDAALVSATDLAVRSQAALRVFAVAPPALSVAAGPDRSRDVGGEAGLELREALTQAVAGLPAAARAEGDLLRGSPAIELIAAAEEGVDLLVLGSRPTGPLQRMVAGSVANTVMQWAPCPVLISPHLASLPDPVPA